jgi:predicted RNase H-like HicB family nuclease
VKFRYETVVRWSGEDRCYVATVPELAGCMADGETQEEALRNVQVVVSEWIETARLLGRDVPEPRDRYVDV